MSNAEIAIRLEAERAKTHERLTALEADFAAMVEASADSNADDEHDPEGATIAFERSQLGALIDQAHRHLEQIDEARNRLAAGTIGVCENCGNPIDADRLEALPVARTCIQCATTASRR